MKLSHKNFCRVFSLNMHDNDRTSARAPPQPPSWKAVREGSLRSTLHAPQGQGAPLLPPALNPIIGYNDVCLGTPTCAQAARQHVWIKTLYHALFGITCAAIRSESAVLKQISGIFRSQLGWKIYAIDMRHGVTKNDQKFMISSRVHRATSYLSQAHVASPPSAWGNCSGHWWGGHRLIS